MNYSINQASMRAALIFSLAYSAAFPIHAAAEMMKSQLNEKRTCLAITTDHSSYMEAVERANALPIVLEWEKSLGSHSRMALGVRDKTEFIDGVCYWSVSFYKSDSSQMQLWKIFRVGISTSDIFMMDHHGKFLPVVLH